MILDTRQVIDHTFVILIKVVEPILSVCPKLLDLFINFSWFLDCLFQPHHSRDSGPDQAKRDFGSIVIFEIEVGEIDAESLLEEVDFATSEGIFMIKRSSRIAVLYIERRLGCHQRFYHFFKIAEDVYGGRHQFQGVGEFRPFDTCFLFFNAGLGRR